jgi:hypothetical protein
MMKESRVKNQEPRVVVLKLKYDFLIPGSWFLTPIFKFA